MVGITKSASIFNRKYKMYFCLLIENYLYELVKNYPFNILLIKYISLLKKMLVVDYTVSCFNNSLTFEISQWDISETFY